MIEEKKKYSVGALLYSPAVNNTVADTICSGLFGSMYSSALCLEDSISDNAVELAEEQLIKTMRTIFSRSRTSDMFVPNIFIRVRTANQAIKLFDLLGDEKDILTGFIFPKYSKNNADDYNHAIIEINEKSSKKVWMMPVLESPDIVDFRTRMDTISYIKEKLDSVYEYVLNVRVGGNDFSNEFAVRRHYDETIYDILPLEQLLGTILSVFSRDYVVSGPVWEFFSSDNDEWKQGLKRELKLDKVSGFIGKTVIHPKQIPVVNEALMVTRKDFEDAKRILDWEDSNLLGVEKSNDGERMNEVKTHYNWARKTILLSEIYGVI